MANGFLPPPIVLTIKTSALIRCKKFWLKIKKTKIFYFFSGLVKYARIGQLIFKYEDEEHGDFDAQSYDYKIIEHIIHPNYPNSENGYDIALLRLDREVKFFRPACLAEQFRPENNTVIATGWALSEYENDFNEYLLKFEQKLLSKNECNDVNNDVDYDDNDVIRTSLQTCAESQVDDEKTECDVSWFHHFILKCF